MKKYHCNSKKVLTIYHCNSKITTSILFTLYKPGGGEPGKQAAKKMYSIKNGVTSEYFYGNKISDYGIEHGFVDYHTLSRAFDCVLNNTIYKAAWDLDDWEQLSGFVDNSEQIEELREQIETLECEITFNSSDDNDAAINASIDALNEKIEDLEQEQEYTPEIFQFYIVDDNGAEILQEINEIVFYNGALDVYLWGVTHWGTSWDYVLTNIPCNTGNYNF